MSTKKTKPTTEIETLASKGGKARKAKLSPERLSEIARAGGLAKAAATAIAEGRQPAPPDHSTSDRPLKATHRGSFKGEFGIDVDCYVLDDEQKTAVISKRGMGLALGMGESGSVFPYFIRGARMLPFVGDELAEKLANPLIFQFRKAGATGRENQDNSAIDQQKRAGASVKMALSHGYDVTILIDVCKAVIAASSVKGVMRTLDQHIVKQANVIVNGSAKHGITQLVYALSGYDATRAEQIAAFKFYVRQEAREYEKAFPDRLYEEWYRLYQVTRPGKNRPWKFKTLTIDHVYKPLAKSSGKIYELVRYQRSKDPKDRGKKLHQFLEQVGLVALGWHLGELVGIAKRAKTRAEYEKNVEEEFGVKRKMIQGELGL